MRITMRKIKILTITLIIVLITMVAFFGVYTHVQNRMENQVKDYSYAMDIDGSRKMTEEDSENLNLWFQQLMERIAMGNE